MLPDSTIYAFSFDLEDTGTKFIKDYDPINGYLLLETPS